MQGYDPGAGFQVYTAWCDHVEVPQYRSITEGEDFREKWCGSCRVHNVGTLPKVRVVQIGRCGVHGRLHSIEA